MANYNILSGVPNRKDQFIMRQESLDFLRQLLTTPSPSGFEAAGQKIWCDYARQFADEVRTDSYGNAIAVLNAGGGPKVLFDGHIDEIGLMVRHIDDHGFIYFQRIGGVDPALVRSKRVNIHTAKGIVRGVCGATAPHLQDKEKEGKTPKMHEMFIDIGAADGKAARKLVSIGDPMTFVEDFEMLNDTVAIARAFDNRIGAWVSIEGLRIAKQSGKKLNCALYACSAIQEEVGLHGAQMLVGSIEPDVAMAIDVTHATDVPGLDAKQFGEVKMGKGPTLTIGRENHPVLVERLKQIAKKKNIPLQFEIFSMTGGTDALAMWTKNGGIPTVIIGVPNRYMHTTAEMIDLRDLQRTADLLGSFVIDFKKNETFKVKI
jgi:putative aminopeptidase FrvX